MQRVFYASAVVKGSDGKLKYKKLKPASMECPWECDGASRDPGDDFYCPCKDGDTGMRCLIDRYMPELLKNSFPGKPYDVTCMTEQKNGRILYLYSIYFDEDKEPPFGTGEHYEEALKIAVNAFKDKPNGA